MWSECVETWIVHKPERVHKFCKRKKKHDDNHLEMSSGIPLLCVDEGGEEDRIPDEEDWGVVAHKVPVTFLCVEFHSKASRVPAGLKGKNKSIL